MKVVNTERCSTGIRGFDDLCEGGFVRNSTNVILGGPGAGKTTFLLQFIWNGANVYKENGLYISFEPDIEGIFEDGMAMGWNFSALESTGKCRFIKMLPNVDIREMKSEILKIIAKNDIKRICIDPISLLTMSLEKERDVREKIFDLASLFKRMKVTTLFADETSDGSDNLSLSEGVARTESIKFLVDGLVTLYSAGLGGETDRAIRITKMRRTNHVRGPVPFKITDGGIVVNPKAR